MWKLNNTKWYLLTFLKHFKKLEWGTLPNLFCEYYSAIQLISKEGAAESAEQKGACGIPVTLPTYQEGVKRYRTPISRLLGRVRQASPTGTKWLVRSDKGPWLRFYCGSGLGSGWESLVLARFQMLIGAKEGSRGAFLSIWPAVGRRAEA